MQALELGRHASTARVLGAPRILLLGGTGDALTIARHLRDDDVYSIAGLGAAPSGLACRVRQGGFGGASGLAQALNAGAFGLLLDATHPYAAQISANAVAAAVQCKVPYWRLERPAWEAAAGDRWIDVDDWSQTLDAVRGFRRPLWTLGREPLAHTDGATPDQHWFVRCLPETAARHGGSGFANRNMPRIDEAVPAWIGDHASTPSRVTLIPARGPFTVATERALIASLGIDVIVSKNSGGAATDAKLHVARDLGLPVIMRRRPAPAWDPLRRQSLQPSSDPDACSAPGNGAVGYDAAQPVGTTASAGVPLRVFSSAAAVLAALSIRST